MDCFDLQYQKFNVKKFLELSYAEGSPKEQFLEFMHAELVKQDKKGGKLLELGTGPSVYTSLLASGYYDNITLSEYAEPNRMELMKWLKQEDGAHDWSRYVNIISKLENNDPVTIEKRTRTAIKQIIPCDLTKNIPVPPYTSEYFDCIVSSITLECSIPDVESYKLAVMKVFDLLVPGGKLILLSVIGQSYYMIDGVRYHVLKLNQNAVQDALKKAGFSEIEIQRIDISKSIVPADGDYTCYIKAIKPAKYTN